MVIAETPTEEESWHSKFLRWQFNFFPAFRRTGARVICISANQQYVKIKLPLKLSTRNYVGTIYGGSMYAAVDPFYMVMFLRTLGPDYVVWDISGRIDHLKPGRSTLTAEFRISTEEIESIKAELANERKIIRDYAVELVDEQQVIHAKIVKTLYFAHKKI